MRIKTEYKSISISKLNYDKLCALRKRYESSTPGTRWSFNDVLDHLLGLSDKFSDAPQQAASGTVCKGNLEVCRNPNNDLEFPEKPDIPVDPVSKQGGVVPKRSDEPMWPEDD